MGKAEALSLLDKSAAIHRQMIRELPAQLPRTRMDVVACERETA